MAELSQREVYVEFRARGGTLRGIVHIPAAETSAPPVVMFGGWGGNRSGPNGILTEAARGIAEDGRAVARFDFLGRGDSDGAVSAHDLRSQIADAAEMVRWVRENVADRPPVLLGICSGGEVAVGALFEGLEADCVCLWSAPLFAAAGTQARRHRRRMAYLRDYARKLLVGETWRKLLRRELRFDLIRRVLGRAGVHDKARHEPDELAATATLPSPVRAALLVYGTADPVADEAIPAYVRLFEGSRCQVHVHRVQGANHGFYSIPWKREVIATTRHWLASR